MEKSDLVFTDCILIHIYWNVQNQIIDKRIWKGIQTLLISVLLTRY
jgi:hypothetical protein